MQMVLVAHHCTQSKNAFLQCMKKVKNDAGFSYTTLYEVNKYCFTM